MAASVLLEPGSRYGSCVPDCVHRDCALTREMAGARCVRCDGEIGYGVRFYRDHETRALVHARCEERAIEEGVE